MGDATGLIGFTVLIVIGGLWLYLRGQTVRIDHLEHEKQRLERSVNELSKRLSSEQVEKKLALEDVDELRKYVLQLKTVYGERFQLFPWLSSAFSELETYRAQHDEFHLAQKSHPAIKASEKIKEYSQKLAAEVKISRAMKYRLLFLESNFPWIQDLTGDDLVSYLEGLEYLSNTENAEKGEEGDPVRDYLAPAEYEKLSPVDRNQRALDRWKMRKKSPWQIGRDYERYIGYKLEQEDYTVEYFGAIYGFDDLGRDIIAHKRAKPKLFNASIGLNTKKFTKNTFFSSLEVLLNM